MPAASHASKKLPVVTVPPVRLSWRIAQYWLNVAVPWMEGASVRVVWYRSYVLPSEVTLPLDWAPETELGLYSPKFSRM